MQQAQRKRAGGMGQIHACQIVGRVFEHAEPHEGTHAPVADDEEKGVALLVLRILDGVGQLVHVAPRTLGGKLLQTAGQRLCRERREEESWKKRWRER